jgi:hypothetical protein
MEAILPPKDLAAHLKGRRAKDAETLGLRGAPE